MQVGTRLGLGRLPEKDGAAKGDGPPPRRGGGTPGTQRVTEALRFGRLLPPGVPADGAHG